MKTSAEYREQARLRFELGVKGWMKDTDATHAQAREGAGQDMMFEAYALLLEIRDLLKAS